MASALIVLDKKILKRKPNSLVRMEKNVIKATAFPNDFTSTPYS